jgi:hypothetical protein
MTTERKPATEATKENQRQNRAAARAAKQSKAQRRQEHEREIAVRMRRRFFPEKLYPEGAPLISLDLRYWQARRCGWDVREKGMAVNDSGEPCHPMESVFWLWWTREVRHTDRVILVKLSKLRLERKRV